MTPPPPHPWNSSNISSHLVAWPVPVSLINGLRWILKFFQNSIYQAEFSKGSQNCKAYLGITFMWMILLIYFKVCHPVYPKGFQKYIAYLIRVCDFEKVELSYLHSIYHIRGSISQGNPTIYRKLRAFHFLHRLFLHF